MTIADDAVVPISQYFKVGTDVYVRFGFDLNGNGDLDSSDTPAVIEATYTAGTSLNDGNIIKGSMSSFNDPAADIFAYTSGSGSTEKTDFVASGYEEQAGNYFVRARKDANGNGVELNDDTETWTSFIIEYATTNGETVDSATGEIWDIDGTNSGAEQFTVTATLADSSTKSSTSPLGNTLDLDAKPWAWSFSGTSSSITQIEFTRKSGTVSGTTYKSFFPLAFNNFNPVSSVGYTGAVPEPSTLAVVAVGSVGVVAGGIRRRRKQKV